MNVVAIACLGGRTDRVTRAADAQQFCSTNRHDHHSPVLLLMCNGQLREGSWWPLWWGSPDGMHGVRGSNPLNSTTTQTQVSRRVVPGLSTPPPPLIRAWGTPGAWRPAPRPAARRSPRPPGPALPRSCAGSGCRSCWPQPTSDAPAKDHASSARCSPATPTIPTTWWGPTIMPSPSSPDTTPCSATPWSHLASTASRYCGDRQIADGVMRRQRRRRGVPGGSG
jgi:hypothetical protein